MKNNGNFSIRPFWRHYDGNPLQMTTKIMRNLDEAGLRKVLVFLARERIVNWPLSPSQMRELAEFLQFPEDLEPLSTNLARDVQTLLHGLNGTGSPGAWNWHKLATPDVQVIFASWTITWLDKDWDGDVSEAVGKVRHLRRESGRISARLQAQRDNVIGRTKKLIESQKVSFKDCHETNTKTRHQSEGREGNNAKLQTKTAELKDEPTDNREENKSLESCRFETTPMESDDQPRSQEQAESANQLQGHPTLNLSNDMNSMPPSMNYLQLEKQQHGAQHLHRAIHDMTNKTTSLESIVADQENALNRLHESHIDLSEKLDAREQEISRLRNQKSAIDQGMEKEQKKNQAVQASLLQTLNDSKTALERSTAQKNLLQAEIHLLQAENKRLTAEKNCLLAEKDRVMKDQERLLGDKEYDLAAVKRHKERSREDAKLVFWMLFIFACFAFVSYGYSRQSLGKRDLT